MSNQTPRVFNQLLTQPVEHILQLAADVLEEGDRELGISEPLLSEIKELLTTSNTNTFGDSLTDTSAITNLQSATEKTDTTVVVEDTTGTSTTPVDNIHTGNTTNTNETEQSTTDASALNTNPLDDPLTDLGLDETLVNQEAEQRKERQANLNPDIITGRLRHDWEQFQSIVGTAKRKIDTIEGIDIPILEHIEHEAALKRRILQLQSKLDILKHSTE